MSLDDLRALTAGADTSAYPEFWAEVAATPETDEMTWRILDRVYQENAMPHPRGCPDLPTDLVRLTAPAERRSLHDTRLEQLSDFAQWVANLNEDGNTTLSEIISRAKTAFQGVVHE